MNVCHITVSEILCIFSRCTYHCFFNLCSVCSLSVCRSKGLGACTLVSRFGAIASPFFLGLSAVHPAWPYVVFFISSITACMCMHRMPETRDRDLPESLQDVYQLIADS
eukprot:scpid96228/ scgid5897/ Solute carrier family 22 member 15-like